VIKKNAAWKTGSRQSEERLWLRLKALLALRRAEGCSGHSEGWSSGVGLRAPGGPSSPPRYHQPNIRAESNGK